MFAETRISQREIRDAVFGRIAEHLSPYLAANKKAGRERIDEYVSKKGARYRPILRRIPDEQLSVDPNIADRELELILHKHLSAIEFQLLADGHDVMHPKPDEDYSTYRERLANYVNDVETVKQSDLAGYVSHRKTIIDLLEMAIERQGDGKYQREDLIHNLIMPMRHDSSEISPDSCNLWLVDEKLAFHDYLASDKTLSAMPITETIDRKEPDILALNAFDRPILVSPTKSPPLASIVVVEIKRPMRNDAQSGTEKDPIRQVLDYLKRIRAGKVTTALGRPIRESGGIPGFCYVLCDLTPSIVKACEERDAIETRDGLGFFFYHKRFKAYVEVISFDGLIKAAKERNRAFFDKLGLPTT